ncbi:hypothetical protein ACJRO7_029896 [Eucalyptus globulus]|uniref:Uncharacterized protein n=1 Tax=Eucalyptus globulus TaxID=34317 RepID=A0ABD3JBV8_EUCGL
MSVAWQERANVEFDRDHPFLLSGSTVADGYGRMLVISVGMNTTWGKIMSLINGNNSKQTPLQARLNKLNLSIGKVGLAVTFLVLVVLPIHLLIHYFIGNTQDENGNQEFVAGQTTGDDIINSVVGTIVMVVFPSCLFDGEDDGGQGDG